MSARGLGVLLGFLGLGGLVLPFFGLQFKILSIFGGADWLVGLVLMVIGGLLFLFGG